MKAQDDMIAFREVVNRRMKICSGCQCFHCLPRRALNIPMMYFRYDQTRSISQTKYYKCQRVQRDGQREARKVEFDTETRNESETKSL